jgi:hypothetical protein
MPLWTVNPEWKDRDVFIIGGGDSLRNFDWSKLRTELTIGCNSAYLHGKDICNICFFADDKFFSETKGFFKGLEAYAQSGGLVATNNGSLLHSRIPWLWTFRREAKGLHTHAIGYNFNTGACAINLALLLGGKRIYLLGFDMKLSAAGQPNWHNQKLLDVPSNGTYERMLDNFKYVEADRAKKFPDREIINLTKDSRLNAFPKIDIDEFWKDRALKKAG